MSAPSTIRGPVVDFVRSLSAHAGDPDAVMREFSKLGREHGEHKAQDIAVLALVLTYGECMTKPAQSGDVVDVTTPTN